MFFKKNKNSDDQIQEELTKLNNKINDYDKQIKKCNNEIKKLKKMQESSDDIFESNYDLFNTLLIDYELKPKGILKNMHALCQEILDFASNVCEKHDLDWWITYGTLLGARRHEGYIPWDDDIDMGMFRKDYDKFNKIVIDEIKNHHMEDYLMPSVNQLYRKHYVLPFAKIDCITQDNLILGGIDVFPFDFVNHKDINYDEFVEYRMVLFTRLALEEDYCTVMKEFFDKFDISYDDGKYIIQDPTFIRYNYNKPIAYLQKDRVLPFGKIKFNGKYYNCPKDVDYFLESEYGDYMKIPKVLRGQHYNVDKLRNIENIEDEYDRFINRLKECNENFE